MCDPVTPCPRAPFRPDRSLWVRAYAAPSTQALRGWQRRAMVKYLSVRPRDFLAVATPGRARPPLPYALRGSCWPRAVWNRSPWWSPLNTSRPSGHRPRPARDRTTRNQATRRHRPPRVSRRRGHLCAGRKPPRRHRVRTENHKTLVIFDEIHHGGDAKSWGDGDPRGVWGRHPPPLP